MINNFNVLFSEKRANFVQTQKHTKKTLQNLLNFKEIARFFPKKENGTTTQLKPNRGRSNMRRLHIEWFKI